MITHGYLYKSNYCTLNKPCTMRHTVITCRHLPAVSVKLTLGYSVYRILEQVGFMVKLLQQLWSWQTVQNQNLYCQRCLQEQFLPRIKQTESPMQGTQLWLVIIIETLASEYRRVAVFI